MATKRKSSGRSRQKKSAAPLRATASTTAFEKALLQDGEEESYVLRLYVAGPGGKSSQALVNIRKICEEHLAGRYELEIIDLYKNAALAKGEQIIAAPTLVKRLPKPLRKFIGDMSDIERILVGLDIRSAPSKG